MGHNGSALFFRSCQKEMIICVEKEKDIKVCAKKRLEIEDKKAMKMKRKIIQNHNK